MTKKTKKPQMTEREKAKWRRASEDSGADLLHGELTGILQELGDTDIPGTVRALTVAMLKLIDERPGALEIVTSGEISCQLARTNGRIDLACEDDTHEADLSGVYFGAVRGLARRLKLEKGAKS